MKRKMAWIMAGMMTLSVVSPGTVFAEESAEAIVISCDDEAEEVSVAEEPVEPESSDEQSEEEPEEDIETEWNGGEKEQENNAEGDGVIETEGASADDAESVSEEEPMVISIEEIQPEDIPEAVAEEAAIAEEASGDIVDHGTCGENLTWTLDLAGTITISGTGEMYDYVYGDDEDESDGTERTSPWINYFYNGFATEDGRKTVCSIVIEEGVTSIGDYAFALDYVWLYEDVEEYGTENARAINVSIAESVTSIGAYAFLYNSPGSITISANVISIGKGAFRTVGTLQEIQVSANNPVYSSVDGVLYNKEQTELICCPCGIKGALELPASLTSLGNSAFSGCVGLTSVVIADGITEIGNNTFYGCTHLTSVTLPDCVTKIGNYAFYNCKRLKQIKLPSGLTEIGVRAFQYCSKLKKIEIPDGVTEISEATFLGCSKMTQITLPASLTSVGVQAFCSCSALTSISIPEGVKSIGNSAFSGCSALTGINLPEGVESIGNEAFYGCSGLTEITLPASLATFDRTIFSNCNNLCSIYVDTDNPVYSSENGILFNKDKSVLILYPAGRTGFYEIPDGVVSIGEYAFGSCTGLTGVSMSDSVTEVCNLAFLSCTGLETVVFSSNLTQIGESAFGYCTSLTNVSLPDSLVEMGDYAFYECSALKSVKLPAGLENIGGNVFYLCENLTEVVIASGVKSLGTDTFRGCTSLTQITLPDTVTSIGEGVFESCGLTEITIPEGVTEIGWSAFSSCNDLKRIALPRSLKEIGRYAFSDCRNLADIYYGGKKADWSAIEIAEFNDSLDSAVMHYNTADMTGKLTSCLISSLENTEKGIVIEWGAVDGADGYYVYRKTSSGKYKKIKTVKKAATVTYTDTAVKNSNGTTYFYKVVPYRDSTKGSGKAQSIVRLTGASITSVTNTASGKIKVKWEAVADVTGYQIKYGSSRKTISKAAKKSVTLTGSFSVGKKYAVRIRTYKEVNGVTYYSAWSSKVYVKVTK